MLSRLVGMTDRDTSTIIAVVIGGGPAGLIAAARLAESGVETTVLEGSSALGGRAASSRQAGFDLNQGAHALYIGGSGLRRLQSLGIDPQGWNPVSHRSVFVRDGRAGRLPGGTAGVVRWLVGVARGGGAARTAGDGLERLTTSQWLTRTLHDPDARAAAAALVRVSTFVADHDALSADVAARQIRLAFTSGVRYVRGGWSRIVDALEAQAVGRGAAIRTRATARAVAPAPGGGWSVTLDDEVLHADAVIVAAGTYADCARLLGDRAPAAPGPAAEVSTLDLGLRALPERGRTFGLGIDVPAYISRHSPPDRRDGVLMSLVRYERGPRSSLDAFADAVQPGWRSQLVLERFLPRMVPVSAIPTPAGGGLAGRPDADRGDGLFVAGDWVGSEGWLLEAALASGSAAADGAIAAARAARTPRAALSR
jgi:phytoene dehydrogenase-like protein